MNTVKYEGRENIAYSQFSTYSNEEFSIQADQVKLSELSAQLSLMTSTISHKSSPQAAPTKKVVKKIIKKPQNGAPEAVGVAAVEAAVHSDIKKQHQQLSDALSDIDHLKESAQQLMKIAEQLRSKNDSDSKNDLGTVLIALGISDPVTKETAGKSYATELARQFATAMKPLLEKSGGVMSVAEAYCLFNRALGTNYVSPNDLADALSQLGRRDFGVKVETIEGVTVVILSNKQYKVILNEILSKFGDDEFTTPLLISKKTQLPMTIARNYLLRAESDGVLCRDDSMAGLRFYKNMFDKFTLMDY